MFFIFDEIHDKRPYLMISSLKKNFYLVCVYDLYPRNTYFLLIYFQN